MPVLDLLIVVLAPVLLGAIVIVLLGAIGVVTVTLSLISNILVGIQVVHVRVDVGIAIVVVTVPVLVVLELSGIRTRFGARDGADC